MAKAPNARSVARELGFGAVDQSRVAVTAVSELARNIIRYATEGRGEVRITSLTAHMGAPGLEIVAADDGPGIADVGLVLREGYTSSGGMGIRLPGIRRLMDELQIDTALGQGTTITIRKWRR